MKKGVGCRRQEKAVWGKAFGLPIHSTTDKNRELPMDHPNVRSCWTKVRLDPSALETVFMIETDLALSPDDPAYNHDVLWS